MAQIVRHEPGEGEKCCGYGCPKTPIFAAENGEFRVPCCPDHKTLAEVKVDKDAKRD